jgi:hypothetical protein
MIPGDSHRDVFIRMKFFSLQPHSLLFYVTAYCYRYFIQLHVVVQLSSSGDASSRLSYLHVMWRA